MMRYFVVVTLLSGLMLQQAYSQPSSKKGKKAVHEAIDDPEWLRTRLEKIRKFYDLPDLGAVVVMKGEVVAASVVGVRKYGTKIAATQDDRFHLGSITKVMTAALIGMMVDDGVLTWNTTMEEMFPELVSVMQPGYRKVTVLQLLSHTGGFPYGPNKSIDQITAEGRDVVERRYGYVKAAIADPLAYEPGTSEAYSGGGVVVMSFVERKVGRSYEDLMFERLYRPLGLSTAGIGDHMASAGKVDAPWGHRQTNGQTIPREPEYTSPANGRQPVGGAYLSMPDLGRYLAFHLQGERGQNELLKPETFKRLHTSAPGTGFAPGWISVKPGWAEGRVLIHNGSIGIHVASAHVALDEDYAIACGTNAAGEPRADKALEEVRQFLVVQIHNRNWNKTTAKPLKKGSPLPPRPDIWLDDVKPIEATVGYGKFEVGSRDGGDPLTLDGDRFTHGLGVHAPSRVSYEIKPNYKRFVGRVGPEERGSWRASVVAEIYIDDKLIEKSPLLKAGDSTWNFNISIPRKATGNAASILHLVITDGEDGINSDSADWVDVGFVTK
ncbi:MAG: penicillin-binding protein beta-lactamase class [Schlesneria sp.]|nr:penicillin-binding protein beta-lactamase class [Schlesneria sp.]